MVIGSTEVSAAAEKGAAPDALYAALTGATRCRVRCGSRCPAGQRVFLPSTRKTKGRMGLTNVASA